MKSVVLVLFLGIITHVSAAPLSCSGITPRLTHDGNGFQIHTPIIDGAQDVDAHVELNGVPDAFNIRMIPSTDPGIYELPQPIQGTSSSPLAFHFTYTSPNAAACDTITYGTATTGHIPQNRAIPAQAAAQAAAPAPAQAQAQAPAMASAAETADCALPPIQHQVMRNDANQIIVQAIGAQPYSWIDLHATIGSSPEMNVRMGHDVATAQSPPMSIPTGAGLTYSLTYAVGDVSCTTEMFATGPLN